MVVNGSNGLVDGHKNGPESMEQCIPGASFRTVQEASEQPYHTHNSAR